MEPNIQSCIQSIKKVVVELQEVSYQTVTLLAKEQNGQSSRETQILKKYINRLNQFNNVVCANLSLDYLTDHIKPISNYLKRILMFFCKDVTQIINNHNLQALQPLLKNLTYDILTLLTNITKLSNAEINKMSKASQSLKAKKKQYDTLNINQESLLRENVIDTVGSGVSTASSSLLRFFATSIDTIFLKQQKSEGVFNYCSNLLSSLSNRLNAIPQHCYVSDIGKFLVSNEMLAVLGAGLGLFLSFGLIRKVFYKLVNAVRDTWNGFWEWTRR